MAATGQWYVQTYLNLGMHMDGAVPSGTVRTVPKEEAGTVARLLGPRGRRPAAATGAHRHIYHGYYDR